MSNPVCEFQIADFHDDWNCEPDNDIKVFNEGDGVRLTFGTEGAIPSDVLIEHDRKTGKWRIFIHPTDGDPIAVVELDAENESATIEDASGNRICDIDHSGTIAKVSK